MDTFDDLWQQAELTRRKLIAAGAAITKLQSIDEIRPIVAKVPDAQVLADLDAARPPPRTAGSACWTGSSSTGWPE